MTRKVLFQIHWLLGISAGLVLAVMGVTGAMMSFQDELMAALSPEVLRVTPGPGPQLLPSALIARAAAARHGTAVAVLSLEADPTRAAQVEFRPADPRQHHGERSYINPYTGQLLGLPHGAQLFLAVRNLHRYLLLPGGARGLGRPITGIAVLSLIFFALSGLYLRWPRQPLQWRNWFSLDLRRRGRDLYRQLHAVIGTWLLLIYLLSALTGLWWSYDIYRQSLVRWLGPAPTVAASPRKSPAHGGQAARIRLDPAVLDQIWHDFRAATGRGFVRASLNLPRQPGAAVVIRSLAPGARYARMTDDWRYDAGNGQLLDVQRYQALPPGAVIVGHILPLHDGSFFGPIGRVVLMLSSLSMPLFTVTGLLLYLGRRRQRQRTPAMVWPAVAEAGTEEGPWVIYASQGGQAQRLAQLTAQAFVELGQRPRLLALNRWQPADMGADQRCLFIVSTYGEGEPPDQGRLFAKAHLRAGDGHRLPAFAYAVLALGNRLYPDFCAFGRQLDAWLERAGARRSFPLLCMDGEQAEAVQQWQRQLQHWGAKAADPDWAPQAFQSWRLLARECLNPAQAADLAYSLWLAPPAGSQPAWVAGDLVEILPALGIDGLRPREYSIASVAAQQQIQLLVRRQRDEHGRPGLCSGWLTADLPVGGLVPLRIRSNPGFHPPAWSAPLILIGNGTGLAGLLAHLRDRSSPGAGASWLLYGERYPEPGSFCAPELEQALQQGLLSRLDRVYSRAGSGPRYVQDRLLQVAPEVQDWVERGASIYVCGSLQGMAAGVDAALRQLLGSARLDGLELAGRYRRDVY